MARSRRKTTTPRRRRRRRPKQLVLAARGRGGYRELAGRPKKPGRQSVPHRARVRFSRLTAVHVTLRVTDALSGINLRSSAIYSVLWRCLCAGSEKPGFRLVHFSVQRNHIHLIVEAHSSERLSRGIQGLCIRIARQVNGHMRRSGRFWQERYHATIQRSPTQTRRTLRYVLLNDRRHARRPVRRCGRVASPRLDALSSALWFDGWLGLLPSCAPRLPVAQSWLLSVGWQRGGSMIDPSDVPGPEP
jgi:REP-associated tyrosine transposase